MKKNKPKKLGRPFKKDACDTKTQILESALDLFAAHGFKGTSIRQIAGSVGITEAGIYAHFDGKNHIYETLFAETGPPVVSDKLASGELETYINDPQAFLLELGQRLIEAWDEPRARKFISVFMREGAIGAADGSINLLSVVEQVQKHLGKFFRQWMEKGLIRHDFSPEHLVWEMVSPLANVRFLYLHSQANEKARQTGRALAKRHLDYFIACILTPNESNSQVKTNSSNSRKAVIPKSAKQKK